MAWRGRPPMVWDLGSPMGAPIRYTPNDSSDSINAPEQLIWKPDTYSLLILCQNTSLVEWRIDANTAANPVVAVSNHYYDNYSRHVHPGEYDEAEIAEFRHIQCWQMSVSPDGRFLLTNDISKTISLWTLPGLNLVYRLLNVDDLVSDLPLSPSGQRFYDARGVMCNIWEPDALIPTEAYEHISEDHTLASPTGFTTPLEPAIGHNHSCAGIGGRKGVVTALDLDASGRYFCAGSEDGSVQIHEAASGARARKVYGHGTSTAVLVINWSQSGKYVVWCDESARVVAKRLQVKEEGKWAVFAVFDSRAAVCL